MANKLMRVLVQNLVDVGRYHGTGVYHGVTQRLGLILLRCLDPDRVQAKGRVLAGNTLDIAKHLTGVDRQFAVRVDLGLGHADTHQRQAIGVGRQIQVVADMYRRHQKAEVLRQFFAHALDTRQ